MAVWSGVKASKYVTGWEDRDIQPNGIDLRIDRIYRLIDEDRRRSLGDAKVYKLRQLEQYVVKFRNSVIIPQEACAIFLPRSTMWRKKGLIICHSLFDTGYTGYPEVFVKPTFDVKLKRDERIGQIVYMDAEPTFEYIGKYKEKIPTLGIV